MKNSKVREVCAHLVAELSKLHYTAERRDPALKRVWTKEEALNHALYLLTQIPGYLDNGQKTKAHRHLGAAQTLMVVFGTWTVSDMMSINKPNPVEDHMLYFVIYEDYTEYNQFEGSWDLRREEFISFEDAELWIEEAQGNNNLRDIVGPLKVVGI